MTKTYLAHSARDDFPYQTYEEHIRNTTKLALTFAKKLKEYCNKDAEQIDNILNFSVTYHDLGKLDQQNQEVLHQENQKSSHLPVNHVDAGTAFLKQKETEALYSLILVYAHHYGLPNVIDEENRTSTACYRDANQKMRSHVDSELESLIQLHRELIPENTEHVQEKCNGDNSMFIRMLYSCLVDADHTDTAQAYGKNGDLKAPRLQPELRLEALNHYIESLNDGSQSKRNTFRTQLYKECRDCELNTEIVSNDSPVGSGKTTAIMAYQLKQAKIRGARRIFVVLPYTNIIEQSVEIYRKALVLPGENPEEVVAELHFRADFESENTRYLTSLWRAPIIVTTAVAFFETLASNKSSTLRKLHELPGSIIFIDEAHAALPIKLLPLAWKWMDILSKEWCCHWILASGSLIRFWQIPELMETTISKVPEMVNSDLRIKLLNFEKSRIQFCWNSYPLNREELIDWVMTQQGPRLLIMNTVQNAAVIARDICKKYGRDHVEHLSTALTPIDRMNTIEVIKKRLLDVKDTNWVLVATSCVEAGVNFSFRVGFREMASVLSLLQTSGRIDRNGSYPDAKIWSFCMQDDVSLTKNPQIKDSAKLLEEYFRKGKDITPELSTQSIKDELKRGENFKEEITDLMEAEEKSNFQTVSKLFHVIDNDAVSVIVDTDIAESIERGDGNWRDIQKYSVSIRKNNIKCWKVKQIVDDVFQWTLSYDSFLGYMRGVLE